MRVYFIVIYIGLEFVKSQKQFAQLQIYAIKHEEPLKKQNFKSKKWLSDESGGAPCKYETYFLTDPFNYSLTCNRQTLRMGQHFAANCAQDRFNK